MSNLTSYLNSLEFAVKDVDSAELPIRKHDFGKAIIRAGEVAGGLAAIGGFVGDFLKPLASINLTVFLSASLLTLILLVLCLKRRTILGYGFGIACFFCLIVAMGFGTWWGLAEFKGGREQGFLASKFGVVGRLQEAVLDVQKVDGARVVSEMEEKKLVETKPTPDETHTLLGNYPANLLSAKTIGGLRTSETSEGELLVSYDLKIGGDVAAFDEFIKRLIPHLESIATSKGETFSIAQPNPSRSSAVATERMLYGIFETNGYNVIKSIKDKAFFDKLMMFESGSREGFNQDWWVSKIDAEKEMAVVVNTARNQVGDRTTWRWYHIRKIHGLPSREKIDVVFLDSRGREIVRDVVTIGPVLPGLAYQLRRFSDESWKAPELVVSPFILNETIYAFNLTIPRQLQMTKAELKSVTSIRCSVSLVAEKVR